MADTLDQLYADWHDRQVPSRGGITGQCVSLVQKYAEYAGVSGTPVFPVAYAREMMGTRPDFFDSIYNSPSGIPQRGDIVVFNGNMGGGAGHTGVVVDADQNKVRLFQQNDPLGSGGTIKTYNYNNIIGWLRLKGQSQPDQGGGVAANTKADFTTIQLAYEIGLNRSATPQEVDARIAAGNTDENVLRDVGASDEHKEFQRLAEAGKSAQKDIAQMNKLIDEKNKEIEQLKKNQGGGVDQETKDQITQTNSTVQWIKDFLNKIFRGENK